MLYDKLKASAQRRAIHETENWVRRYPLTNVSLTEMKQHSPATAGMTWLVKRNFAVLEKYGILESLNVKVRMFQLFWIKGTPWEIFLLQWLVTAWINSFLVFLSGPLPFSLLRTVLIIKHKPINVSSRKKKSL